MLDEMKLETQDQGGLDMSIGGTIICWEKDADDGDGGTARQRAHRVI